MKNIIIYLILISVLTNCCINIFNKNSKGNSIYLNEKNCFCKKNKKTDIIYDLVCYLDKDIDTNCLSKKKIESLIVSFDKNYNFELNKIKKLSKLNCDNLYLHLKGFTRKNIEAFFETTDFGENMRNLHMYDVSDSLYKEILINIDKKYKKINSIFITGNMDSIYFNENNLLKNLKSISLGVIYNNKYSLTHSLSASYIEKINLNYSTYSDINNVDILSRMEKLTHIDIKVNTKEKIVINFSLLDKLKHLKKINFILGSGGWKINNKDYKSLESYSNVSLSVMW